MPTKGTQGFSSNHSSDSNNKVLVVAVTVLVNEVFLALEDHGKGDLLEATMDAFFASTIASIGVVPPRLRDMVQNDRTFDLAGETRDLREALGAALPCDIREAVCDRVFAAIHARSQGATRGHTGASAVSSFPMSEFVRNIQIGQPYVAGVTTWPETPQFNFNVGGYTLEIFASHPDAEEIGAFMFGRFNMSLVRLRLALLLVVRFEMGRTSMSFDAPYSWHRVPEQLRKFPDVNVPLGLGDVLQMVLIDSATGVVRGIRICSMTNAFSLALAEVIAHQTKEAFDARALEEEIAKAFVTFPTSKALEAVATCRMQLPQVAVTEGANSAVNPLPRRR